MKTLIQIIEDIELVDLRDAGLIAVWLGVLYMLLWCVCGGEPW